MARRVREPGSRNRWGWYERVNAALRPYLGPADLGAGHPETAETRSTESPCPICRRPMSQHSVERAAGQYEPTRLHCP